MNSQILKCKILKIWATVSINETKNDKRRQFIIGEHFYDKVKKYISLRPSDLSSDMFFIQYQKGKCVHQVIDLQDANRYTGHCFRRTGATLLSDSSANITMLKQLGRWKSTNIAQVILVIFSTDYVENSMKNREKIYESIIHASVPNTHSVLLQCQPSTSKNSSSKIIANGSALSEAVDDDVFDDIEISEQDLIAIDQISKKKK
ncbi:uncharacterized protein LOC100679699 isoform X1 [Nasonia vitripennis]|uniref:Uncharacterized protein n=1 Tax=Nasonia vitripennis TaxID=7425 RepID=A0A7M7QMP7_NASVI|nr:uncharacterized protein LOC100679699 isoform X1 [Nasonia vitripennis]XP_031788816.1 uncharacterized protein LOC100679699 isoform X1 [Nasonia vitripennis]